MTDDQHEKALDLTEEALEKLAHDDEKSAQELLKRAKLLDKSAPEEVLRDLDEDAADREHAGSKTSQSK